MAMSLADLDGFDAELVAQTNAAGGRMLRMAGLAPAEALAVTALRRWAAAQSGDGRLQTRMMCADFRSALGAATTGAIAAFLRFVAVLGASRCQPFRHYAPCCPLLAVDEANFAGLLRACAGGRWGEARLFADRLAGDGAAGDLLGAASVLASALSRDAGAGESPDAREGPAR